MVEKPGKKPYNFKGHRSYHFQVNEVHQCLKKALTEHPTLPLATTLKVMETMDIIRKKIGLQYPCEK